MGAILHIRKKVGSGTFDVGGNDTVELEKNDIIQGTAYNVPDLPYVIETSKIHVSDVVHTANIDIDDLTDAQLRAILNDTDTQSQSLFGNE